MPWQDVTAQAGPVHWADPTNSVIRNQEKLDKLYRVATLGSHPKPPTIDFGKRLAVLIATGPRSSTGYSLSVESVTELRDNTFYASITLQQNGSEIEIDSRPSDAIALAVRAEAPIFADDKVIEESAIEFEGDEVNEEEIVDEFKKFLDRVSPDEFAVEDEEES